MPLTWADDRALLRKQPERRPRGQTEWGGTMPPSSIRDGTKALNPSRWRPEPLVTSRQRSALTIRLPFAQHVPDEGGQLAHHRHARDAGAPAAFDALEPL